MRFRRNVKRPRETLPSELRRSRSRYLTITVPVYLPRPIALRARREVYPYSLPQQKLKKFRTRRFALVRQKGPHVLTKVRLRVPMTLPVVRGSYVSLSRNRLNVHSIAQHRAALAAGELNRKRRNERKSNRRKARHGQLESPGSTAYGLVAGAFHRGMSPDRIADHALVARSILKGGI